MDIPTLTEVMECVNRQIQKHFDPKKVTVVPIPEASDAPMIALALVTAATSSVQNATTVAVYTMLLTDTCQLPETQTDRSLFVTSLYPGVNDRRITLLKKLYSNVKFQNNAGFIALETKDLLHDQTCESFVRSAVYTANRYLN